MRSRSRRGPLVVAVVAAVALGWAGLRTLRADDGPAVRESVPVTAVSVPPPASSTVAAADASVASDVPVAVTDPDPGPHADASGIPVGYGRSEAGARAAAVGWVSSLGALMQLGPIATADSLRALMSERVAAATIDSFRAERAQFNQRFGADPSQGIWLEAPLAVTVDDWSPERAVVRVWSQLMMGVASEPTAQVMWRTHTVTLVWEHDDWRVDDVSRSEGPTPEAMAGDLPSSGRDMAEVAGWTPAVLAGSNVEGS